MEPIAVRTGQSFVVELPIPGRAPLDSLWVVRGAQSAAGTGRAEYVSDDIEAPASGPHTTGFVHKFLFRGVDVGTTVLMFERMSVDADDFEDAALERHNVPLTVTPEVERSAPSL